MKETVHYHKLVRDKIPQIIRNEGYLPETEILSDEAYRTALEKKLSEEVHEYLSDNTVEELADILEVIDALCALHGAALSDILRIKEDKKSARGGFSEKLFLISKSREVGN